MGISLEIIESSLYHNTFLLGEIKKSQIKVSEATYVS